MRRRFWVHNAGEAFKKWRQNLYEITVETTIQTVEETNKLVEIHQEKVNKIKDKNCDRSSKIVVKTRKHNVFQAWKNVAKWLKKSRTATRDYNENSGAYQAIRALKKWRARAAFTQVCRDRKAKQKAFTNLLYKKAVFKALLTKYQREKKFCLLLHSFSHKVNQKQTQSGFEMIKEFYLQKLKVYDIQQKYSCKDLISCLHTLWHKRMQRYYSNLRENVLTDKEQCAKVINLFGHFGDRAAMRNFFNRWKKQSQKAFTV